MCEWSMTPSRRFQALMKSCLCRENQDLDDEDEREWATAQAARANPYKTPDVTNRAAAKAIYTPAMGRSDFLLSLGRRYIADDLVNVLSSRC